MATMGNPGAESTTFMLGGALNNEVFHGGHGSSTMTAPAISPTNLDLLDGSVMLNHVDSDVLLSGLGLTSGIDEWMLPPDGNFTPYEMLDPVIAEHAPSQYAQMNTLKTCQNVASIGPLEVRHSLLPKGSKPDGCISSSRPMELSCAQKECFLDQGDPFQMRKVMSHESLTDVVGQLDQSDNSDGMEEDESEKASLNGKPSLSKNLVSERRRRKKLNERLYSLRAIVPNISKMDKASIVGDAITYVQELKQRIEDMQNDILALQSSQRVMQEGRADLSLFHSSLSTSHKIFELDVLEMEGNTFHLRIHCKKGPGALVQITRALEALDLEILNANLTLVGDHILCTIIVKVKNDEVINAMELKDMIRVIVPKFNLEL